ncbi:hypothetical protein SDC9_71590 [bioreactor metagenome]|uniref:Uncharacterized protein n=1 Tax=bioreactor metagenome TaxID=1076179 RepID=A0A644Y9D5_9ZZZZ
MRVNAFFNVLTNIFFIEPQYFVEIIKNMDIGCSFSRPDIRQHTLTVSRTIYMTV